MKTKRSSDADLINRPEHLEVDENRDPISGAHGAHPVGTGVGAATGGAAGAAIGAAAGPVGAVAGLVVGAVAGGYAGKGVAEIVDPTVEDAYWKDEYMNRPYAEERISYDNYQRAYRTGYEGYAKYPDKTFDEVESKLKHDYEKAQDSTDLGWDKAKHPARDAWDRVASGQSSHLDDARR